MAHPGCLCPEAQSMTQGDLKATWSSLEHLGFSGKHGKTAQLFLGKAHDVLFRWIVDI